MIIPVRRRCASHPLTQQKVPLGAVGCAGRDGTAGAGGGGMGGGMLASEGPSASADGALAVRRLFFPVSPGFGHAFASICEED